MAESHWAPMPVTRRRCRELISASAAAVTVSTLKISFITDYETTLFVTGLLVQPVSWDGPIVRQQGHRLNRGCAEPLLADEQISEGTVEAGGEGSEAARCSRGEAREAWERKRKNKNLWLRKTNRRSTVRDTTIAIGGGRMAA
uniref:Uncharacterized protein n=1 Tax=Leersia perrieri TaxID=77586 RepID=A0A0D9XYL6_9ORYZ